MILNGELEYCYSQKNALYTHIQNLHEAYTYRQPATITITATNITETTVPTMMPMVFFSSDGTAVVTREKNIHAAFILYNHKQKVPS